MVTGIDVFFYTNPFVHFRRSPACKGMRFHMGLEGNVGLIASQQVLELIQFCIRACFPQYDCLASLYDTKTKAGSVWTYPVTANVTDMIWLMGVTAALLPGKWQGKDALRAHCERRAFFLTRAARFVRPSVRSGVARCDWAHYRAVDMCRWPALQPAAQHARNGHVAQSVRPGKE